MKWLPLQWTQLESKRFGWGNIGKEKKVNSGPRESRTPVSRTKISCATAYTMGPSVENLDQNTQFCNFKNRCSTQTNKLVMVDLDGKLE
jgi:hypothetical protein